jgi:hypothetical protein
MTNTEVVVIDENDYGHFIDTETMQRIDDQPIIKPTKPSFRHIYGQNFNNRNYITIYAYAAVSILTVGGTILLFEYIHA